MKESPEIYNQLTPKTPEVIERFSEKLFRKEDIELEESKFEKFFEAHEKELKESLQELLDLWDTKEHRETIGHDNVHITYDLFEWVQLSQGADLPMSQKYMTLYGSLLHDLGRYPELLFTERSGAIDFTKGKQIQLHAALSAKIGAMLARKYKRVENDPENKEASLAFTRRIIGAVAFHGGANETRDPVAHHVQSLDRLAGILGSREFVRNVVTDGVSRGARVYPDERLSYDKMLPGFNNLPPEKYADAIDNPKESWTNIVHYLEMPMRNMFPLSTEFGMERAAAMRRESGIILTLLSGGESSPLYQQIFAPELNPKDSYDFPKTRLPKEIWDSIKNGLTEEEVLEMQKHKDSTMDELIDIMLDQQAPDITPESRDKTHELLANVPNNHKKDIQTTLLYIVSRRKLNVLIEKEFLENVAESEDPLVQLIVSRLLKHSLFNPPGSLNKTS